METLDAGVERFGVLAAADEEDGFLKFFAGADAYRLAVEHGHAAFLDGPGLADHGIVDHTDDDLVVHAERDGDAEMGDAVEVVHRAVDGIDDPLAAGGLVPGDAFLSVKGIARACAEEDGGDEILGFLVEGQLDVVVMGLIHNQ